MSTYIYLQCLDHDPPLTAVEESGQHLYDLPQVFLDLANREYLAGLWELGDAADLGYFRNRTAQFLSQHKTCRIRVVDEYGQVHEPEPPEAAG